MVVPAVVKRMYSSTKCIIAALLITFPLVSSAAVTFQQSRVIFDGSKSSTSLIVNNQNPLLPYLARSWIEDEEGNRVRGPLVVLPPIQRIDPGESSQIKIQALPSANLLRQDRETLFYLNLREVPPRDGVVNSLQIALQNRIKIFYRPAALKAPVNTLATPWQSQLVITRQDDRLYLSNPSAYYITLVEAKTGAGGLPVANFRPLMLAPGAKDRLPGSASDYGATPVFTYINDYGGRPEVSFSCNGLRCVTIGNKVPDK